MLQIRAIPLVDLEEEIIDKDVTQSYWLALQFVRTIKNKPNGIFVVGLPQVSHGTKISCDARPPVHSPHKISKKERLIAV